MATPRRRSRRRLGRPLAIACLVAAAVALVGAPLAVLLRAALEEGLGTLVESSLAAGPAVLATVWTSLLAAALAVGLGAAIAVITERTEVAGRGALRLAMLLALIMPGYVAALGWLSAYGPGGLIDDLFGLQVSALVGPLGIVLVMAAEAAPIAFLIVVAGLRTRAEPDLERAARASGASARETLTTVTLPLLRPVLVGAGAIAFVLSATSFGVPAVLGIPAGFTTMTTRIYRDLAFSADPASFGEAVGLAVVLAVGAAIIIALGDWLLGRGGSDRSGAFGGPTGSMGPGPGPITPGAGHGRWPVGPADGHRLDGRGDHRGPAARGSARHRPGSSARASIRCRPTGRWTTSGQRPTGARCRRWRTAWCSPLPRPWASSRWPCWR